MATDFTYKTISAVFFSGLRNIFSMETLYEESNINALTIRLHKPSYFISVDHKEALQLGSGHLDHVVSVLFSWNVLSLT